MYEAVIGLEIHAELKTRSKMFCGCLNDPLEKHPNINVCPICLGHPGVLPVINSEAVKAVLKTGLALNCRIPEKSKFDRKNYFYPDLPKGYQISQYDEPLCLEGYLEIPEIDEIRPFDFAQVVPSRVEERNPKSEIKPNNQNPKKIRIRRIHLEEDTGRLAHPEGADYSLVDFNRAGIPLMELVTEPDIRSGSEARRFAEKLQLIFKYLGVSDADMEKGQMRVEVNISLQHKSEIRPFDFAQVVPSRVEERNPKSETNSKSEIQNSKLGTKVEIKNLNSFRSVEKAINYEIERQTEVLKNKEKVIQETRGWNADKEKTFSQRKKEEAHDYRYFPEPDLPILSLLSSESEIREGQNGASRPFGKKGGGAAIIDLEKIKAGIPELPAERRARFGREYGLPPADVEIFAANKGLGDYFEAVASELAQTEKEEKHKGHIGPEIFKIAANWLISDLQNILKETCSEAKDSRITAENFAEFVFLIHNGKISSRAAKDILKIMFETGGDPSQIMEERGLKQVSDTSELENWVKEVIRENPGPVEYFKNGKVQILQFLIGKVMQKSKGRSNPQIIGELLKNNLTNK